LQNYSDIKSFFIKDLLKKAKKHEKQ